MFQKIVKELDIKAQRAFRIPSRPDQKRTSPCSIIAKMKRIQKKDYLPKSSIEMPSYLQRQTYQNDRRPLSSTLIARREGTAVFQAQLPIKITIPS
jgi:hypothetical protein